MAVVDKYVDALVEADKLTVAGFNEGGNVKRIVAIVELAADDDDGSVFRLAKALNPDFIITQIQLFNDAIAGATSFDLGFYEPTVDGVTGIVIDKDALLAAEDINAGNPRGSAVDGLGAVDLADSQKRIYELAGDTQANKRAKGYDIALTANTVGTAVGTITIYIDVMQG